MFQYQHFPLIIDDNSRSGDGKASVSQAHRHAPKRAWDVVPDTADKILEHLLASIARDIFHLSFDVFIGHFSRIHFVSIRVIWWIVFLFSPRHEQLISRMRDSNSTHRLTPLTRIEGTL
jgi:hypothetical protein